MTDAQKIAKEEKGDRLAGPPSAPEHGMSLSIDEAIISLAKGINFPDIALEIFALCSRPKMRDARGNIIFVFDGDSESLFQSVYQDKWYVRDAGDEDPYFIPIPKLRKTDPGKADCLANGLWSLPEMGFLTDFLMVVSPEREILKIKNFDRPTDYAVPPDGHMRTVWTFN